MTALTGRCVLVTGATQGLGLAAARRFAQAGCHVVLNGLADPDAAHALIREIEAHGVRAVHDDADLRRPDDIARMVERTVERIGPVDVLVNNAVVRSAGPIDSLETSAWDEAMAVNLSSAFHTIRLTLPAMKARGWGRIINVSSIYGLTGAPSRAAYVTTKTALIGLTRAVALEVSGFDITCNAICPGTVETPVHQAAIDGIMQATGRSHADAERQFLSTKQPSGRFVSADAVTGMMLFLCGPDSRDINGAALPIDAAWSIA